MHLTIRQSALLAVLAAAAVAMTAVSQMITVRAAVGVEPAVVEVTINAGASTAVPKVVHTPVIPPKPDVLFLADTTGSMQETLDNVKANATAIMNAVLAADPSAQFAAASYRDLFECPTDGYAYNLDHAITADVAAVQTAISANWNTASGVGCDTPEQQLNALFTLATDAATGFRSGSTRIVVWFGDSTGHDPSNGHTLPDVINALQAAGIRVIAIAVNTGSGDGLDGSGQATAITGATGGVLLSGPTPQQVSDAIVSGLANLPVEVTPQVGTCDPSLIVTFDPTTQTVTSGLDAAFSETIAVAADASQCGTLTCTVNWLIDGSPVLLEDGSPDPAFVQSITVTVPDVTLPEIDCGDDIEVGNDPGLCSAVVATYNVTVSDNCPGVTYVCVPPAGSTFPKGVTTVTCVATDAAGNTADCSFEVTVLDTEAPVGVCSQGTNPDGNTVPGANASPKAGQNPDGFYLLSATDNCDASPAIFLKDSASSFVAGPFAPGSTVKITQAPGVTPNQKPGVGVVVAKIQIKGDALLWAVDDDGNVSAISACHVPPPPK